MASQTHAQLIKSKELNRVFLFSKTDSTNHILSFVPANFATCDYGFFCKQELKLEKYTRIPIKFRLASMEYSNWLEGKTKYKPIH